MKTFLSLGSNVGDRENHLRAALFQLQRRRIGVERSASTYLTEPRDYAEQPWFLNTVIETTTELTPLDLLQQCLTIEREAGRVRTVEKGPRSIDIDIILYGSFFVQTPELTIPHPRYANRRFVLVPLAEIAPDFVDPVRRLSVKQLLERTSDSGSVQLYGPPLF